jgi:hypothetical protein
MTMKAYVDTSLHVDPYLQMDISGFVPESFNGHISGPSMD